MNDLDLRTEAVLDETIRFQMPQSENLNNPKSVFLTGATGFLGVYLLAELLDKTSADVYCLVRASDSTEAGNRIKSQLELYRLWNETTGHRIIPIIGDLSKPLLGMPEPEFYDMAGKIDVIFHNGAKVNFLYPYSALKSANVSGTREVLRLAGLTRTKPVHFMSSMAVFFTRPHFSKREVKEIDIPQWDESLKGGYKESKWVAEQLVIEARKRGLPACIYRPVRIMGHSLTGITGNYSDILFYLLKGCILLKKYPKVDTIITFVPVDYLSQAIVHLSRKPASMGKAFHFFNPHPISFKDFFEQIKALGYPLEEVSFDQWTTDLKSRIEKEPKNNLFSFLGIFMRGPDILLAINNLTLDAAQTLEGLTGSSIVCPPIDEKLISTYISYLQQSGFIDYPLKKKTI
ncbi:MAG: thioester reductase domain-containing protein [Desulfosalsimonadaceae bacterium]|nr:thioester reductase domain-containing protein [Desulfosalsimonadaceae bacterium]